MDAWQRELVDRILAELGVPAAGVTDEQADAWVRKALDAGVPLKYWIRRTLDEASA